MAIRYCLSKVNLCFQSVFRYACSYIVSNQCDTLSSDEVYFLIMLLLVYMHNSVLRNKQHGGDDQVILSVYHIE